MDRYVVISADGHAGPPSEVYRGYLDADFRERFDEHQRAMAELRAAMGQGNAAFREEWEAETDGDGGLTAAFDSEARKEILDVEGVAAEVLFPDADVLGTGRIASSPFGTGLGGDNSDPAQAVAGSRAHNRWLADFVAQDPVRHIGVAVIPAIIPDMDTVLDLVREAKEPRTPGHPHPHPLVRPTGVPRPLLRAAVGTHRGPRARAPHPLRRRTDRHRHGPGDAADLRLRGGLVGGRPLAVLIWGGVFERHPNLRYSMAENGGVVGARPDPQDGREVDRGPQHPQVRGRLPPRSVDEAAHYLDRNCFFAASTPGEDDIERRGLIGVGNLMWGNDLPHPEGTFPYTRYWMNERFQDVPEDETRHILGFTAAEVYDVDLDGDAAAGRSHRPTTDEVHGDVPRPASAHA